MLPPDDLARLRHMLDHSKEAVELTAGKDRAELDDSRVLQLAVIRLMEIVGEAAGHVSEETQSSYPEVPWPQIIGMRNRLVHGYGFVDFDILWQTVHDDLPKLIVQLEKIVPSSDKSL